ncbi:Uncharacterised protein [Mycobacteroides abscessus]|nr:Uncharacterised protein [Mycobacteroides abscessus]
MPRRRASSPNVVRRISKSARGGATKVPRPCARSSTPSVTSASTAWRTVMRETPNFSVRLRSDGTASPTESSLATRSAR